MYRYFTCAARLFKVKALNIFEILIILTIFYREIWFSQNIICDILGFLDHIGLSWCNQVIQLSLVVYLASLYNYRYTTTPRCITL